MVATRKEARTEPTVVGDILWWGRVVALPSQTPLPGEPVPGPTVIQNKDGTFMATIGYRGPDVTMMDYAQWCFYLEGWNRLYKQLHGGWAMWADEWHEPARAYPKSRWTNPAGAFVDALRETTHNQGDLADTDQFLTLTWQPPSWRKQYWYDSIFVRRTQGRYGREDAVQLRQYIQAMEKVFDLLSPLLRRCVWLSPKETATYLRRQVSWDRHALVMPEDGLYLDRRLGTTRYQTGLTPVLGEGPYAHLLRSITIRTWPKTLGITVPATLQQFGEPYRYTVRQLFLDNADAKKRLKGHANRWQFQVLPLSVHAMDAWNGTRTAWDDPDVPVNEEARERVYELQRAIAAISSEDIGYSYASPVITLWADTPQQLAQRERTVLKLLQVDEMSLEPEYENADEAWQSTHVGNAYANVRNPLISTRAGAFLTPHGAVDDGEPYDTHWRGPAILTASSQGHPYYLSLHRPRSERGNFMILGPMRMGKSAMMALLGLGALKYDGIQIFAFDRGYSLYCATLMANGAHYTLGTGVQAGFQPLGDLDSEAALRFRQEWLQDLFEAEGEAVTVEDRAAIRAALVAMARQPRAERRMSLYRRYLQPPRLKRALEPYCAGERYDCFDAMTDSFAFGTQWTTFEMGAMFDLPAHVCALGLAYLFHEMERTFDGRPTLILLDEAWQFAKHPIFWPKIHRYLKAEAKNNVCLGLSSQETVDMRDTEIWQALQGSIDKWIFLPNEAAMHTDVLPQYQACGLTEAHTALLTQMVPYRDYLIKDGQHVRVIQCAMDPLQRCPVASSKPEEIRALRRLTQQPLTEPLLPAWLRANEYPEAADLCNEFFSGMELA
jgi:Type IV secretory pathway, VirB4 components